LRRRAAARQLLDARATADFAGCFREHAAIDCGLSRPCRHREDLLDHGADIDHRNSTGDTALLLAAAYPIRLAEPYGRPSARHRAMTRRARIAGARAATHYRNLDNESAIELAGANGNVEAALDLLAHGAAFDPSNDFEATRCIGPLPKAMPRWRRPCSIAALRQTAHRATARRP